MKSKAVIWKFQLKVCYLLVANYYRFSKRRKRELSLSTTFRKNFSELNLLAHTHSPTYFGN